MTDQQKIKKVKNFITSEFGADPKSLDDIVSFFIDGDKIIAREGMGGASHCYKIEGDQVFYFGEIED